MIAQQDYIRVEFTGAFSAMDATTKAKLNALKKAGSIYEAIVVSSTEGESRVLGVFDTVAAGVITKTEIALIKEGDTLTSVAIYEA